jgi:hypothetical protein
MDFNWCRLFLGTYLDVLDGKMIDVLTGQNLSKSEFGNALARYKWPIVNR